MKKVLKSAAAILLVLTLAFSAFAIGGVFAEETEPLSSFAVSAKGSGADSTALGTVSWWKSDVDGKYYMFMPSKSDLSSITVWFTATDDVMWAESSSKTAHRQECSQTAASLSSASATRSTR